MFKMEHFVKENGVYLLCLCVPEASLELGKRRTLRKSSSIWLTLHPPIKVALWVGTRKLYRYVAVETQLEKQQTKRRRVSRNIGGEGIT